MIRWTRSLILMQCRLRLHMLMRSYLGCKIRPGCRSSSQIEQRRGIDSEPDQQKGEYDKHEGGAWRYHLNRSGLRWGRVQRYDDAQVVEKAGDARNHEDEDQVPCRNRGSGGEHIKLAQKTHGRRNAGEREQSGGEHAGDHWPLPKEAAVVLQIVRIAL